MLKIDQFTFESGEWFDITVADGEIRAIPLISMQIETNLWALAAVGSLRLLQLVKRRKRWSRGHLERIVAVAAARGRTQFVLELQLECDTGSVAGMCAAAKGHAAAAMELLAKSSESSKFITIQHMIETALASGHVSVFDAAIARVDYRRHMRTFEPETNKIYQLVGDALAKAMCIAAFRGNAPAIHRLLFAGVPFPLSAARAAVAGGHEDLLSKFRVTHPRCHNLNFDRTK